MKIADFSQPPFNQYHWNANTNVSLLTSTTTHTLYLQSLDTTSATNNGEIFSADISNPASVTQASWKHIATIPYGITTIPYGVVAFFGLNSNQQTKTDQLYSAVFKAFMQKHALVYTVVPGGQPVYLSNLEQATALATAPSGALYVGLPNSLVYTTNNGATVTPILLPPSVVSQCNRYQCWNKGVSVF